MNPTDDVCEVDGCGQPGEQYVWADADGNEEVWLLCSDHAAEVGFCPGCDCYMGGADDDHLARVGVCYECWTEMLDEVESWAENE